MYITPSTPMPAVRTAYEKTINESMPEWLCTSLHEVSSREWQWLTDVNKRFLSEMHLLFSTNFALLVATLNSIIFHDFTAARMLPTPKKYSWLTFKQKQTVNYASLTKGPLTGLVAERAFFTVSTIGLTFTLKHANMPHSHSSPDIIVSHGGAMCTDRYICFQPVLVNCSAHCRTVDHCWRQALLSGYYYSLEAKLLDSTSQPVERLRLDLWVLLLKRI